eukprot:1763-Heterococcus_DN1.PRE.3
MKFTRASVLVEQQRAVPVPVAAAVGDAFERQQLTRNAFPYVSTQEHGINCGCVVVRAPVHLLLTTTYSTTQRCIERLTRSLKPSFILQGHATALLAVLYTYCTTTHGACMLHLRLQTTVDTVPANRLQTVALIETRYRSGYSSATLSAEQEPEVSAKASHDGTELIWINSTTLILIKELLERRSTHSSATASVRAVQASAR